jgi:hypothetical protein
MNYDSYQSSEKSVGQGWDSDGYNGGTLAGQQRYPIKELRKKERKNTCRLEYSEEFEKTYEAYPRREGKSSGFKVYRRDIVSAEDRLRLQTAIKNYKFAKRGTEPKFLMMFSTFMNQWEDWLDPKTGTVVSINSVNQMPISLGEVK